MTIFVIKIIACITMVFDHIKYAIPITENWITLYLGRVAFPLFAFLITEGYVHTSNLKKYIGRLIIFGLISQIPFMLFRTLVGEWKMLNIMFTLLLGLLAITAYDKISRKYISIPICIVLIILGEVLKVDYGWFGVALVFVIYLCKKQKYVLPFAYTGLLVIFFYYNKMLKFHPIYIKYFIGYLIPLIFIMLYNGKQGKKVKYFFYAFYPVHMIILYLITLI